MRSTDGERGGREEGSWVIKGAAAGIQWSLTEQPEEVDLALLWAQSYRQMYEKSHLLPPTNQYPTD